MISSFSISLSTFFEYLLPLKEGYSLGACVSIIVFTLLFLASLISMPLLISSVLFLVNFGTTFPINSTIESALNLSMLFGNCISLIVPSSVNEKIALGYLEPSGLFSTSFKVDSSKSLKEVKSWSVSSDFTWEFKIIKEAVLIKVFFIFCLSSK